MSHVVAPPRPDTEVVRALAPTGALRVGINLSNFLLVSGAGEDGEPVGVSPSLAGALAGAIGVPVLRIGYVEPGEVVEAVASGVVDVGNVGADPDRAEHVIFSAPYCEIEATFLVPAGSTIVDMDAVDAPGVRVAAKAGAAYTLFLDRSLKRAKVVHAQSIEQSLQMFIADRLEVLAGLRPRLLEDAERLPGSKVLDGQFTSVQQAIGLRRDRGPEAHGYLEQFVSWATGSGLIAGLIDQHQVKGLSVARPPAT